MKNTDRKQKDSGGFSRVGLKVLSDQLRQLQIDQIPVMTRDVNRLNQLAKNCIRLQQNAPSDGQDNSLNAQVKNSLVELNRQLEKSTQCYQKRLNQCPEPKYDDVLPITAKIEQIRDAIQENQVVVLAGDTGSGKSTQIPKICLQAGRGLHGHIAHTQPRRIAARSVAERISEELGTELGSVVGYKVRFHDQSSSDSYIKLMTDGILLAELQRDRYLSAYDTIIIDEAHERSLNIDFILGYLKSLLRQRADLKVIITSATIDTQKFSKHFDDAPVITVEGRTFPVEVHYIELNRDEKDDVSSVVKHTVETIYKKHTLGDILVFLSGEAEIRRCMDVLSKRNFSQTIVLPLYSRLANNAQHAIFKSTKQRKIILATNIAETSLTIPGIRYVIDPGYARISRYNFRRKVQRLPIEKISQASANQRMGRCGRVSDGVCYRLYSAEDFEQREEFTEPEIKRSNLASVILQMEASKLGDINNFAFIDPPEHHFINDGYKLLFELAAVDDDHHLTNVGRQLARYPVDPRLAKMLIAAKTEQCLYEIIIIVSALSIQDIREQSMDSGAKKGDGATHSHQEFYENNGAKQSDFIFFLNVWEEIKAFRMGELKRFCKQFRFSFLRMIEWRDIVKQIRSTVSEVEKQKDKNDHGQLNNERELASYNQIHRAILPGLITLVGMKNDDGSYQAPRNINFLVSHRSGLQKKAIKWVMAESLVQTSRLYANNVAKIYPKWIEEMAQHLIKTSYYDIDWDEKRGGVVAYESTTLHGLTIQSRRKVDYGKRDHKASQPIFIQKALVERQIKSSLEFLQHNFDLFEQMESLEAKFRVRNIIINDARIFDLYNQHIPDTVCSEETLRMWVKSHPTQAENLKFQQHEICNIELQSLDHSSFPETLALHGHNMALSYRFEPGHIDDGITIDIPIFLLDSVHEQDFDCLVPGLLKEKLIALIKSLPKSLRTSFIPATNFANECFADIQPGRGALPVQFAEILKKKTSRIIAEENWQLEKIPAHLKMNFRIRSNDGVLLQSGRELSLLKYLLKEDMEQAETVAPKNTIEREGIISWDFGELPRSVQIKVDDFTIKKFPALVDKIESVHIKLFSDSQQASFATRAGLRRLFEFTHVKKVKYMQRNIPNLVKMGLLYAPLGSATDLQRLLETLIIDTALFKNNSIAEFTNKNKFSQYADEAEKSLLLEMNQISELVCEILEQRQIASKMLTNIDSTAEGLKSDTELQMNRLFATDFLITTPLFWLQRYPAYMRALSKRYENYPKSPAADQDRQRQIEPYEQKLTDFIGSEKIVQSDKKLQRYRWMLEEFRISLFAQGIKTIEPVSRQRLDRLIAEIKKG